MQEVNKYYNHWEAFNCYATENIQFNEQFRRTSVSNRTYQNLKIGVPKIHFANSVKLQQKFLTVEFFFSESKEKFASYAYKSDMMRELTGLDLTFIEAGKNDRILVTSEFTIDIYRESEWIDHFKWFVEVDMEMYACL